MLQKARQPKYGGYKTILERWHNDNEYRESLSKIGWTGQHIIQYDEPALEGSLLYYNKRERHHNEKSSQGPTNQRPDFVEAKREMKRLHDEHVQETSEGNTPIHPVQRSRQRRSHQFERLENIIIKSMPKQDGEPILRSHAETCRGIQHIRPRQISGSNTMIGSRTKVGSLGDPHPGLNSSDFLLQRCFFFTCRKVNSLAIGGGCRRIRLPHATFSHVKSLHRIHSTDDMCTMAEDKLCAAKHTFIHESLVHPLLHATLSTCSPSLSSTSLVLSSSSPNRDLLSTYPIIHCEDPRQDGTSTEYSSST